MNTDEQKLRRFLIRQYLFTGCGYTAENAINTLAQMSKLEPHEMGQRLGRAIRFAESQHSVIGRKDKPADMTEDNKEALQAALEAYYQNRSEQDRQQWIDEGIHTVYHLLLREAIEPLDRGEKDKAAIDAHYQRFAGALEHMRKTWPFLDRK